MTKRENSTTIVEANTYPEVHKEKEGGNYLGNILSARDLNKSHAIGSVIKAYTNQDTAYSGAQADIFDIELELFNEI